MAEYDLEDVKRRVAAGQIRITGRNARDCVIGNWEPLPGFAIELDEDAAERVISGRLASLQERDFHETLRNDTPPADVYRVLDPQGHEWYAKFIVQAGSVIVISFHRAERAMR